MTVINILSIVFLTKFKTTKTKMHAENKKIYLKTILYAEMTTLE